MHRPNAERTSGFTLVELVVVIVVLGIIAAFAAPRFFDDRTFLERGYYEELVAGLKYAQKLAVASGCDVHVVINDSGYRVRQQAEQDESCDEDDATWPTDVALADGDVLAGSKPFGIIMSEDVTLTFDALGATDLGADEEVGVGQFEFTIHAASGYIEAP